MSTRMGCAHHIVPSTSKAPQHLSLDPRTHCSWILLTLCHTRYESQLPIQFQQLFYSTSFTTPSTLSSLCVLSSLVLQSSVSFLRAKRRR
jgi:hypothetical protein